METQPSDPKDNRYKVTWGELRVMCNDLYLKMKEDWTHIDGFPSYGIPTGGCFVLYNMPGRLQIVDDIENSKFIFDDIVDSGKTISKCRGRDTRTAVLFVKEGTNVMPDYYVRKIPSNLWVQFPWEREKEIEDVVIRQLEYIGENPNREGLVRTPARVIKAKTDITVIIAIQF